MLTGVNSQDGNYGALVSFSGCAGCTSYNIVAGHPIVTNPKQGDTYTATAYVKSEDVAGRKVKLEIRETGGAARCRPPPRRRRRSATCGPSSP